MCFVSFHLVDDLDKATTTDLDHLGSNSSARGGGGPHSHHSAHRSSTNQNDMYLSVDNLERLEKDNVTTTTRNNSSSGGGGVGNSLLLSDAKLRNIITYLDEVDTAERLSQIDQELVRANEALENPAPLVPSGGELAQLEVVSANAAEVTSTVLRQKMELEEKKRSVTILQKALVSGDVTGAD